MEACRRKKSDAPSNAPDCRCQLSGVRPPGPLIVMTVTARCLEASQSSTRSLSRAYKYLINA